MKTVMGILLTSGGKHDLAEAKCPVCEMENLCETGQFIPEVKVCDHFWDFLDDGLKFIFKEEEKYVW